AIADANPDWILVMDRDAAISADDPEYVPANEILDSADALASVTAVTEGNIVYMPADTYTNESIQTYTEVCDQLVDDLEADAAASPQRACAPPPRLPAAPRSPAVHPAPRTRAPAAAPPRTRAPARRQAGDRHRGRRAAARRLAVRRRLRQLRCRGRRRDGLDHP